MIETLTSESATGEGQDDKLRFELSIDEEGYPQRLKDARNPPEVLRGIGDIGLLTEDCIAIVGSRRATPYGLACAKRFAEIATNEGFCVISGGSLGVSAAAHGAALASGGKTIAVLGCGADVPYPKKNNELFGQIKSNGAVLSERRWGEPPLPYAFRERNRIIAALASAVLVCEAGLPSGVFSIADEALAMGRAVLAVPGQITSAQSTGANQLILQGCMPIVDDSTFVEALASIRRA